MTRFRDTDPVRSADAEQARGVKDAMQSRIDQLEENINAFIASVAEVTFNVDEADAQSWMSNWQANLLSGRVGADAPADVADEDTAADPR